MMAKLVQDEVEADMRKLSLELKQTMEMYNAACKEALTAHQKVSVYGNYVIENRGETERITVYGAASGTEQLEYRGRKETRGGKAVEGSGGGNCRERERKKQSGEGSRRSGKENCKGGNKEKSRRGTEVSERSRGNEESVGKSNTEG